MRLLTARNIGLLLIGGLVLAWFLVLRPSALGGPASYIFVSGDSMLPALKTGDLVVLQAADSYQQDDVVAFHIPAGEPGGGSLVIHRIIGGSEADGFVMRGDNKDRADDWRPMPDAIVGHLWVHLPGAGAAVAWVRQPAVFAPIMAGLVVFFILMGGQGDQKRRTATPQVAARD